MATRQNHLQLNYKRVFLAASLLILPFCLVSIAVGVLSNSVVSIIATFIIGLIITPVIASPIEWAGHKYICHRKFALLQRIYTIHLAHHYLYFPPRHYTTSDGVRRIPIFRKSVKTPQISKVQNAMTCLGHFGFYVFLGLIFISLPAWILSRNLAFLFGTVSGTVIISILFISVHDTVHRPGSHRIMKNQGWFHFIDEYHYIHHVDNNVNFNFLLPLADWLFGTCRKTLTNEELAKYGSRETTKAFIHGVGETANKVIINKQKMKSTTTWTL